MTSQKNNRNNTENQDIEMNDDLLGNDLGGDGYPDCEGEPCVNMADEDDNMAGLGSEGKSENKGEGETNGGSKGEKNAPENEESPEYQAALWKEKYMRLSAEYDNYRKRTFKEKMDIINAGGEDVVRSMLEVLDDMDRALVAMAKTDDMEAVKQGIMLIDTKLRGALKSRGLAEIEAVGSELDTDLHEAIARIAVEEDEWKGKIIDVVQKGYKLRDKIIRYAKVVVGQ